MLLRDFYCHNCETVTEDLHVEKDALALRLWCKTCNAQTDHIAVCNGGTNSRYRFCDLPEDPEYYRGQVKVTSATAHTSSGEPLRRYTSGTREVGGVIHEEDRWKDGSDTRETKRDELKHETRRKRGRLPIVCDLGAKP